MTTPFDESSRFSTDEKASHKEPFPLGDLIDTVDDCTHFFEHTPTEPWPGSKLHHLNEIASVGPLTVHRLLKSSLFRAIQTLRSANGMWFSQTPFKNGDDIGFRKTATDIPALVILIRTVEMASSRVNWVLLPSNTTISAERAKQLIRNECASILATKNHTAGLETQAGLKIPAAFEKAILEAQQSRFRGLEPVSQSKIIKEAAESFAAYLGLDSDHPPFSQDQTVHMWNLSSVIAHGQGWTATSDISEALMPLLIQWVEVVAQHINLAALRLQACSTTN